MPSKTEEYLALAQRTANGLTRYWESWTDYLTTASRLYKYPFADQLMIYAQRPDATACAEFDIWRNRMNRYVRRGSKGIALLDESSGFPRLHYVFDVSDTGVRRNSRDPEVWQLGPDLVQPVSEMLAATYGISGERVSQQLADVAGKLVADYWDNNSGDILAIVDGSLLMDYDEAGVEMQFKSAAAISVTYTLLERCGFEPAGWFDKDDFRAIHEFSTPDAVYALGAAVSDMSRELVGEGRCADAVRLIRKDNPFPTACAYICEHPCEARCRRNMIDDAINIRGLKRYAVDHAGDVPQPVCAPPTGKKVAIIGGGPSGLSCAYYLALMGHKVTVFEERAKLGGMLRYGIPSYRFPRHLLDAEIDSILSLGIEAHTNTAVGTDVWVEELQKDYDCLYIAIGAHQDKKVGIPGEDCKNVMSAVEMLRAIGDDVMPDFTGKQVVVIGGGNVAMDVTRSSIRLGAEKVTCVYRRRIEDMTALPDEVTGAMAEGAEIEALMAPVRIEADEDGCAAALWVQPQIIGEADKSGRPRPNKADLPERRIPADIIVVAIGQGIEIQGFEQAGVPIKRGVFVAGLSGQVGDMDNLFAGGDCVTGPATAIRAIAAGKVAAANIDVHLGFQHEIEVDVDIPSPRLNNRGPHGRINTTEREACERRCDFEDIECGLTEEGARTEASRCLRCDHFGYGIFRGGRNVKW